ncbi:MAG: UDP-2,3-diacylglucosamine diphosphatase [Saprospirales bacterium]|jgi:UDP-2,3-diacylglucosamine pyrophosphatase LpxH|nr:UDP-2,3-diacylglucosamine diphosphatase [Saprospirales bacterium]MBK8922475.1 UDP-2,3-diacylglucosamine diphosphatase [Saprospirales bacterium]
MRRDLEIVVLSDIHLGTYGCHARELHNYLRSINPRTLVLNGDIFDIWYFKKSYFPKEHLEVVRRIMKMAVNGTKVYYLTGNHDDLLRKFGELSFGLVHLRNKLVFQLDGKTHWVFHGDVFDASIQRARWLARLGGEGYDLLIRINRTINGIRRLFGFASVSFASKIKKSVKGAVRYISDFEDTAIQLAAEKGYDYVVCGHIHRPQMRAVTAGNGKQVMYMNSGDWIEHLTALEFANGAWQIYQYDETEFDVVSPRLKVPERESKIYTLKREEVLPDLNSSGLAAMDAL